MSAAFSVCALIIPFSKTSLLSINVFNEAIYPTKTESKEQCINSSGPYVFDSRCPAFFELIFLLQWLAAYPPWEQHLTGSNFSFFESTPSTWEWFNSLDRVRTLCNKLQVKPHLWHLLKTVSLAYRVEGKTKPRNVMDFVQGLHHVLNK